MHKCPTVLGLALLLSAGAALAGDDFSMGLEGHGRTGPADVGLPVYAGAQPFQESKDDKAAVTLGAWVGQYGLHLAALKYRSAAPAERVAAFYAKELGRYGEVLDCRQVANRIKPPKGSDRLACDKGGPELGAYEYRVGTAKSFRVVSVKPDGDGSRFDMARVRIDY